MVEFLCNSYAIRMQFVCKTYAKRMQSVCKTYAKRMQSVCKVYAKTYGAANLNKHNKMHENAPKCKNARNKKNIAQNAKTNTKTQRMKKIKN